MLTVLVVLLALLGWVVLTWVLWLRCLVDAWRRPAFAYRTVERSRMVTFCLILLTGWIGGIYYWFVIRPDLAAAEASAGDRAELPRAAGRPGQQVASVGAGIQPAPVTSSRSAVLTDRELFIRAIPAELTRTDSIPPSSAFAPLRFSRQDVIDAVRALDPGANVAEHRITVTQPEFTITASFPLQDPLLEVLLRVRSAGTGDGADRFLGQLLARLDARAFDTGSPTLVFTPPAG